MQTTLVDIQPLSNTRSASAPIIGKTPRVHNPTDLYPMYRGKSLQYLTAQKAILTSSLNFALFLFCCMLLLLLFFFFNYSLALVLCLDFLLSKYLSSFIYFFSMRQFFFSLLFCLPFFIFSTVLTLSYLKNSLIFLLFYLILLMNFFHYLGTICIFLPF